jgi:hypothetical protein
MAQIGCLLALAGTALPAAAQLNLMGYWSPVYHEDNEERIPGPEIGDYAGLPINDAARLRAESWEAALLTLPEHQCKPHPSTYGFRGVSGTPASINASEVPQTVAIEDEPLDSVISETTRMG